MMRMKAVLTAGVAAAALAIALTGCSSQSSGGGSSSDSTAPASSTKLTGTFDGANGKKVSGDVTISGSTVKLSDFSSDEGPDLHLYLADGTTEADIAAGVEIDTISYDKAAQSFTLDSGVDAAKYSEIVVHCDKAKATFGAAELSQ